MGDYVQQICLLAVDSQRWVAVLAVGEMAWRGHGRRGRRRQVNAVEVAFEEEAAVVLALADEAITMTHAGEDRDGLAAVDDVEVVHGSRVDEDRVDMEVASSDLWPDPARCDGGWSSTTATSSACVGG